MFFSMVRQGNNSSFWSMYPKVTPSRTVILPAEGLMSPAARERMVVLPQPEGPMTAMNSPCPTEKVRSLRAAVSPCGV